MASLLGVTVRVGYCLRCDDERSCSCREGKDWRRDVDPRPYHTVHPPPPTTHTHPITHTIPFNELGSSLRQLSLFRFFDKPIDAYILYFFLGGVFYLTFPIFCVVYFLIRGLTLEGAGIGIKRMFKPDVSACTFFYSWFEHSTVCIVYLAHLNLRDMHH